ncbi:MAG: Holliday junction resolvase RuvX [Candidatus Edwardsbacteria bacterium]|nr:Holliday junction resolvase RuvX [Candidatus Edwardsbacteria bacterium]
MKFSGRLLGLDLGRKRVGVAVSDETATIASPLITITIAGKRDLAGKVKALVAEHQAVAVVVSRPSRLDRSDTDFSSIARKIKIYLEEHLSVPVHQYDERLTSKMAQRAIHDSGRKLKGSKNDLDKVAAAIMLADFLKKHHDPR